MSQQMKLAMSWGRVLVLARHTVTGVGLWITLGWGTPAPLGAQTPVQQVPTPPAAEAPQTLEPLVVTGRADDLLGVAGSASEGRVG